MVDGVGAVTAVVVVEGFSSSEVLEVEAHAELIIENTKSKQNKEVCFLLISFVGE